MDLITPVKWILYAAWCTIVAGTIGVAVIYGVLWIVALM